MKVQAIWEFEVDTEGLDSKFIDIPGLAKDLTKRELDVLIDKGDISAEDFIYIVEGEKTNENC